MKNKISSTANYFGDYQLLAIVSPLKDYTLSYFINEQLDLHLKKYDDLRISEEGGLFSWYYYKQGSKYMSYFLIGNKHPKQKLIPALKEFDFLFLMKNAIDKQQLQLVAARIRSIKNVIAVFEQKMSLINDMDMLIECNEFHEMDQIITGSKKTKNK